VVIILILTVVFVLGIGVSQYAHGKFQDSMRQGHRAVAPENLTGAQIAGEFLRGQGVLDVRILPHEGVISDYFDPLRRCLYLRRDTHDGKNLAAWSVALHEAAHALQNGEDKEALKWRHTCINLTRYLPTTMGIIAVVMMAALKLPFRLALMAFAALCAASMVLNIGSLAIEYNANQRLRRWLNERLERHPDALDKMEIILAAVATRELGDILRSPRYFFLTALPGTGGRRPS